MNKYLARSNSDSIRGSRTRELIAVAIAFAMMAVGCLVLTNLSDPSSADPTSGSCGDNLTWSYDSSSKTLTITGNGAMTDYEEYGPWHNYANEMKTIVFNGECTHIGNNAFRGLGGVNSVTLPDTSLQSIGDGAFQACYAVTSFSLGKNVATIGSQAFASCADLREITVAAENTHFCDVNGVLFDKAQKTLIKFPDHKYLTYNYDIPSGTTTLGSDSFSGNQILETVTVPATVTQIAAGAFNHMTWLQTITVDANNTAYASQDGVLFDKGITTLIQFPSRNEGVNKAYTVPASVTAIAAKGFENCELLTSITLPANLQHIGDRAFDFAQSLTSITIPASATDLGVSLFVNAGLESVTVNAAVETLPAYMFNYCSSLTSVTLPSDLKNTGEFVFEGCHGLTSITLPDSVTTIGTGTFTGCNTLSNVGFPVSLQQIGDHAFDGCTALPQNFALPEGLTSIGQSAFAGCTGMRFVTLPTTVQTIGGHAFDGCSGMEGISLPDGLTSIGEGAFQNCYALSFIIIPEGVTQIPDSAFSGCGVLSHIYIPSTVTTFGQNLFAHGFFDGETELTMEQTRGKTFDLKLDKYQLVSGILPDSLGGSPVRPVTGDTGATAYLPLSPTRSGYDFGGWYADKQFTKPYDFTTIPGGTTFVYAKWYHKVNEGTCGDGLTWTFTPANWTLTISGTGAMTDYKESPWQGYYVKTVVIGDGCTHIGDNAFGLGWEITSVTLPASLTSIGERSFFACRHLTSVDIGANVSSIGRNAFTGCLALDNINVAYGNASFSDVDGVLFNKYHTTLVKYPAGKAASEYTIPSTVRTVGPDVFNNCVNLETITIPASVTQIEYGAFSYTMKLQTIIVDGASQSFAVSDGVLFSKDLTVLIQYPAVKDGSEYDVPDTVTTIGDFAFGACCSLEQITMPEGLQQIGKAAFADMAKLKTITIPASVTVLGDAVFTGCSVESVVIEAAIETLPADTFDFCPNLISVVLPDGLTNIGEYAFYDCTSLAYVVIPEGVTTVRTSAFDSCNILRFVYVPTTITAVEDYAFPYPFYDGDTKLTVEQMRGKSFALVYDRYQPCSAIIFETNGGSAVQPIAGASGDPAAEPAEPTKFACYFDGWYADSAFQAPYAFSTIPAGSTFVYAKWDKDYVVTFSVDGAITSTQYGRTGDTIVPPADPVKPSDEKFDYTFNRWDGYTQGMTISGDANFDAVFDKTVKPTKDPNGTYDVDIADSSAAFTSDSMTTIKTDAVSHPDVKLEVSLGSGHVVFDNDAVKSMSTAAATLNLSQLSKDALPDDVKKTVGDNPVIEISFGDNVSFGDGKATVTVPYTVKSGQDVSKLVVCFIKDGKVAERLDCTYSDGKVTFVTGHFSMYALMDETPNSSGLSITLIAAIAGVIAVLCIVAAVFIIRSRR